jgi:hypothetical protein
MEKLIEKFENNWNENLLPFINIFDLCLPSKGDLHGLFPF